MDTSAKFARVRLYELSTERLDTGFYSTDFFVAKEFLQHSGLQIKKIGEISEPWSFGAYALTNEIVWTDEKGIPFFKAESLGSPAVEESGLSYVTEQTHAKLVKSQLGPGDIIVSTSGTIGRVAVVPRYMDKANSNQDTIKFNPRNSRVDNHFVAIQLCSRYGQVFLRREANGTIQQHIYLYNFKQVPLVLPHPDAQAYIGNKVRQAEALRAKARENRLMVEEIFNLFSAVPNSNRVWHVEPDNLHSYRLNANHYIPLVLETIQRVRLSHGTKTLKEILNERKLAGGETPKGAVYGEKGVCFLRVQNVKPWKISRLDAVFIDPKTDNKLKRSRCVAGDIVLSITGYPGTASLVTEQDLPANINQHSVRFGVIWPAGYVVAALNSKFVRSQVSRLVIGETREALDYPSVLDLHIPVIATEQMYEIDFQVKTTIFMEQCAETLIKAARFLVEALIERKVTEADLIAAHNDPAVDRGLMQRLTVDGLDVPGAAPLFGDLDRLQTLLAEISAPEGGSDEL